jgi:hypothetical protein
MDHTQVLGDVGHVESCLVRFETVLVSVQDMVHSLGQI